jgi:hypothetical protein
VLVKLLLVAAASPPLELTVDVDPSEPVAALPVVVLPFDRPIELLVPLAVCTVELVVPPVDAAVFCVSPVADPDAASLVAASFWVSLPHAPRSASNDAMATRIADFMGRLMEAPPF